MSPVVTNNCLIGLKAHSIEGKSLLILAEELLAVDGCWEGRASLFPYVKYKLQVFFKDVASLRLAVSQRMASHSGV